MIGFCMTGSFCSFEKSLTAMEKLAQKYEILPIMSDNAYKLDTKFGKASDFRERIKSITGKNILHTIPDAEPIGPSIKLDCLLVCPCTGNTLSKIAAGITDTPVAMAVKAHLRNERPVLIALATNDGLSGSAPAIGKLLQRRFVYFVPFAQDSPFKKPRSLVCEFDKIPEALSLAIDLKQIQPIIST